ncbi:MAG: hypothetical protein AAF572_17050 [Cyanobacteria bacterium P01_B01_bin.77]
MGWPHSSSHPLMRVVSDCSIFSISLGDYQFLEWTQSVTLPTPINDRLKRLREKPLFFQRTFDVPDAYRTNNQVDRPMNYLDRALYVMQDFHDTWDVAEHSVRSIVILWNFHPFCQKTQQ